METGNLILTRTPGEALVIDGPAEVELVRIQGNRARLAIRAPQTTRVRRKELPQLEGKDGGHGSPGQDRPTDTDGPTD